MGGGCDGGTMSGPDACCANAGGGGIRTGAVVAGGGIAAVIAALGAGNGVAAADGAAPASAPAALSGLAFEFCDIRPQSRRNSPTCIAIEILKIPVRSEPRLKSGTTTSCGPDFALVHKLSTANSASPHSTGFLQMWSIWTRNFNVRLPCEGSRSMRKSSFHFG